MQTVTLHCEAGNHSWERPAQRGRKPLNCPDHAPAPVVRAEGGTVTLHCEAGNHSWERPSQRGKRPKSCPDCIASASTPERREPKPRATATVNPADYPGEQGRKVAHYVRMIERTGDSFYVNALKHETRKRDRGLTPDWSN